MCNQTAETLLSFFDASSECNLVASVEQGFTYGGYFTGWLDEFTSKIGFIISLFNLAITADSANLMLQS
jgi:hypothetical protein